MKTLILFLSSIAFATEPTDKELLQAIVIATKDAELTAARHAQAMRAAQDLEKENIAANGAILARKLAACKKAGGAKIDDCEYDFVAWKIIRKPQKEPAQ